MQQLQEDERQRAQAAQAKNELEAYIISTQGRLEDEEVQAVTTDKQRQAFAKDLGKVEEWLYDQGEHEQASVFRSAHVVLLLNVAACLVTCPSFQVPGAYAQ